jgi:hypothetical protein
MSISFKRLFHRRGSALITVVFLVFIMGMLATSLLKYSGGERRGNERNRTILRAKNMAENVALYASEQVGTKIKKLRSISTQKFGTSNPLRLPPSDVLTTQFSTSSDVSVFGGIASTTTLALITDTNDPNYGLQVMTAKIPLIASAQMTHPALGSVRAYVEQDLLANMVPLFQFGVFYNGDLEVSPGADMVLSGPVHTNGNLIARSQSGFANTVQFTDRVSAVGGLFAKTGFKGTIYNEYDSADSGPGGTGPLNFQNPSGTVTNIQNSSGVWRDHYYGNSTVTTTSLSNFKTFATNTYAGNLTTSVHNVAKLELPGLDDTANNAAHVCVEPASSADTAALIGSKFSRNVGLYIIVNPDDQSRTGTLPDASTVTMAARSYRCWLNSVDSSGAYTITEVVLPGQPSYGNNNSIRNYLPNRYTNLTVHGSNQVLRIPQQDYGSARSYTLSAAHAAATSTINVSGGTGAIPAGEVVTIGSNRYLVVSALSSGSFRISPGLLAAQASGDTVTPLTPFGQVGNGTSSYTLNSSAALGATTLAVKCSAGTPGIIIPGNTITVGTYKYLVTGAPTTAPATNAVINITIAAPGLVAAAASGAACNVDPTTSYALGTGTSYFTSAATASGATSLSLNTGTGTIMPGNQLYVDGARYVVASVTSSELPSGPMTTVQIVPSFTPSSGTSTAAGAAVFVDPYPYSGYRVATATLSNSSTVIPDCYFYDLRRATNSNGHPYDRPTNNFKPRPIAKIDFDMARFKMAVNRTLAASAATLLSTDTSTTGYIADIPNSTNWSSNVLNPSAATATLKHGTGSGSTFTTYPATTNAGTRTRLDPFRIYFAPGATPPSGYATNDAALGDDPSLFGAGSASFDNPWYDGVTVYIHSVDAEVLTESSPGVRNRIDSGVRLWNGRGAVPTLSTTGKTGFSFCTNDAAYVVGHFNADGTVTSSITSTTNPGGYSGRFPESANEKLAAIMSDALTILSQPEFTNSGSNYYQLDGWCDALSGNRVRSTAWSTTWDTSNPSTSNGADGVNTSIKPAIMPNLGTNWPGTGTAQDTKSSPNVTEISSCFVTGVVETNSNQHSGGLHNFPRLLESWSGTGLYIRGSMVSMFYSVVATEPWSIRIYSGAGRFWGLHESLRNAGHDVPLEPQLQSVQRLGFRELSKAEFDAQKTIIQALP